MADEMADELGDVFGDGFGDALGDDETLGESALAGAEGCESVVGRGALAGVFAGVFASVFTGRESPLAGSSPNSEAASSKVESSGVFDHDEGLKWIPELGVAELGIAELGVADGAAIVIPGFQSGGAMICTIPPHPGQDKICPIADSSQTRRRRRQVVQVM